MARGPLVVGMTLLGLVLTAPVGARAADGFDPHNARDVMRTCAACHGEFGQGGGGGAYPRLAGLNADYLADQIRKFKTRERENIPMIPYATERELPERDIVDVTRFLAAIKLETRLPELGGAIDGLDRLNQTKKVLQIPRADGDLAKGKELYEENCLACHGRDGMGRVKKPQLAGQFTGYLKIQIGHFLSGARSHEQKDDPLRELKASEIDDILAHISTLDD